MIFRVGVSMGETGATEVFNDISATVLPEMLRDAYIRSSTCETNHEATRVEIASNLRSYLKE